MNPKECRYSKEHEWVLPDGDGHVKIGITDYAQNALGDIVFVELPANGTNLEASTPFGSVEAVKTVSDLFSPVGGVVVEVNTVLQDDPALVNRSPYGDGWMIRVKLAEPAQLESLMTAEAYEEMVKGLEG